MLAKRIIPTLLHRGRQMVKGERFNAWRSVGLIEQAVRIHQARSVDEIVLLDIAATPENRGPDLGLIEQLADSLHSPLTVGGGIRTAQHVRDALAHGADKVLICTAAVERPELISDLAARFGTQAIVAGIDVGHFICAHCAVLHPCVLSRCGEDAIEIDGVMTEPKRLAAQYDELGAGEIMLTSVDVEGTLQGYDLDLVRSVSRAVSIPVIAHGGAGTYEHMREAIEAGASAVAAGAMFLFTDQTPRGAAEYLQQHGIEVRIP